MPSEYERLQIESLLQRDQGGVVRGSSLVLLSESPQSIELHRQAIAPALAACDLDANVFVKVFDSDSNLSDVCRPLATAEVIVADLTGEAGHLMYVLGLAHGMSRCPILLTRDASTLPFNLASLRFVEYQPGTDGMNKLSEHLKRAIRVFLQASRKRAGHHGGHNE